MNALEVNRYTTAWRVIGQSVPRPRAILVISAHWYVNFTAVTAMPQPRTIHDFYGFPRPLFEVQYPAPGDERLAQEIAEVAKPTHGTRSRQLGARPRHLVGTRPRLSSS
jgi:4,5-DOPA dioxygenase extradiol